jgi:DOMON domain
MVKRQFFTFLSMVCFFSLSCSAQSKSTPKMKSIAVGGMTIAWHFEAKNLIVEATAPDEGWVGIGFNPKDDIVHTNLILAGLSYTKEPYFSERYVLGFGNHQPVKELGGKEAAQLLNAQQEKGITTVRFAIATTATDQFHYDLHEGTTIYLICAYSMSNDLAHHSRMRQHIKVVL